MRFSPAAFLLLFILLSPERVQAESVFVIDKLLVGIHEQKNLDSAILKVLPTGSRLEILQRDGEVALVEDAEKTKGWVDVAYLSAEPPAALRLTEVEKENAALKKKLEAGRTGSGDGSGVDTAEVETLTRENTELKGKLSDERLRAEKLQGEVSILRAQAEQQNAPPDARILELERDREDLKEQLNDAAAQVAELSARTSQHATTAMIPLVLREYGATIAIAALTLLLLAFALGAYVVDLLNRRRHGGFRV